MSPFLGLSLKRGPARHSFIADQELVVSTTEPVSEPIEDWTTIISVANPIGNEIAQVAPLVRAIPQEIAEVVRGADGKVQSIQVDIGRSLGLGSKVVDISAEKIERVAGLKVNLSESELRSLPEVKKQ